MEEWIDKEVHAVKNSLMKLLLLKAGCLILNFLRFTCHLKSNMTKTTDSLNISMSRNNV